METTRRHFVYWLFDVDGRPLYVGATRYPEQRLRQHMRKPWFGEVALKRMAGPFAKAVALRLERQQQDELQPRYDGRQKMMRTRARTLPQAPTCYSQAEAFGADCFTDLFVVVPDEEVA